jgi:hypothetical protein
LWAWVILTYLFALGLQELHDLGHGPRHDGGRQDCGHGLRQDGGGGWAHVAELGSLSRGWPWGRTSVVGGLRQWSSAALAAGDLGAGRTSAASWPGSRRRAVELGSHGRQGRTSADDSKNASRREATYFCTLFLLKDKMLHRLGSFVGGRNCYAQWLSQAIFFRLSALVGVCLSERCRSSQSILDVSSVNVRRGKSYTPKLFGSETASI